MGRNKNSPENTDDDLKEFIEEQWNSYKELILTLTNNKIELINGKELGVILQSYQRKSFIELSSASEIQKVRRFLEEKIDIELTIPLFRIQLAVTEAVTNSIKHSLTESELLCRVELWQSERKLLIRILDNGHGIKLNDLPKVTLIRGYSTHQSLGQGFYLMTKLSSKLYVNSDRTGTAIGLLFKDDPEQSCQAKNIAEQLV
jgi:anti-sigma regulatory factor (Ser/Thr protein kinase)